MVARLIYAALILAAVWFLLPVYLMLITGMKTYDQVNITTMWAFPNPISLDGFTQAWEKVAPNFKNSILITVPAAILSAFWGSINGYVFAKWKFPGSNLLFILFLVGMFLPYQGVLIPLVFTLMRLGLYGKLVGRDLHPLRLRHRHHRADVSRVLRGDPERVDRCIED